MISAVVGLLFSTGFAAAYFIFNSPRQRVGLKDNKIRSRIIENLNMDGYREQAAAIGWKIDRKELLIMIIAALLATAIVAALTNNPLVLISGILLGLLTPKLLIDKKRRSMRINLLTKLTDPLRLLLSRLPEQQNITRAIELTRDETVDEQIRLLLDGYLRDVALGGGVRDALLGMKNKVKLKKFDIVIENLVSTLRRIYR